MRKIFFAQSVFCLAVLVFLDSGCSEHKSRQVVIKIDLCIGVEDGDERCMFASIENIALDGEENIYVLDRKNLRIQKFDRYGKFLKSLEIWEGKSAKEIPRLFGMAVTEKGKIYVMDYNGTRIFLFDEDGLLLNMFRIDFKGVHIISYSEEMVVVLGFKDRHIFHVFTPEGTRVDSFGDPFEVPEEYAEYDYIDFLKTPRRADRSVDGKMFVMNPHRYEIRVYEGRELTRLIRHESRFFQPVKIRKRRIYVSMLFPWVPVFEHENRLYVTMRAMEEDAQNQLDVFEDYECVASLKVEGLPYAIDREGRLYFAEEEGFPRVARYSVAYR